MPEVDEPAVRSGEDLRKLAAVDGTAGAYGEQLEALRLIAADLRGEAPLMQTVFSPLATLSRITGSTRFVQKLIREHPDDLETGLETLTQTLVSYARACLETGRERDLLRGRGVGLGGQHLVGGLRSLRRAVRYSDPGGGEGRADERAARLPRP